MCTHSQQGRFLPAVELLEDRRLLSANVISGYVYDDLNGNGIRDGNELGLGNSLIELHNAAGTLVGAATTDASGGYLFNTDNSISTTLQSQVTTLTFADGRTNTPQAQSLAQFNPAVGSLQAVEISVNGRITSVIRIENLDDQSATVNGNVSGAITLSGPGFSINTAINGVQTATQTLAAYDNNSDYSGSSGVTFPGQTANGTSSRLFSSSTELAPFIGTGSINLSFLAHATSSASGGGNLLANIGSQGGGTVIVTYRYYLNRNLQAGNYTLIQRPEPAGFLDGQESQGTAIIPNSIGSDSIAVTLTNSDSTNNNFGEYPPAAISGIVYNDANNDGLWQTSEKLFANITLTLTGTDDTGHPVNVTAKTDANGFYHFDNLRPGNYTITQKNHPSGYTAGASTPGSLGGTATKGKIIAIATSVGDVGTDYLFAELSVHAPSAIGTFGKGSYIRGVPVHPPSPTVTPPPPAPPPAPPPPPPDPITITPVTLGKGTYVR